MPQKSALRLSILLPLVVAAGWVFIAVHFEKRAYDLGIHTQAAWSCAFDKPLATTLWGFPSMLNHHASPFFCLTAMAQQISPGFSSMVWMSALTLALGAFLLWRFLAGRSLAMANVLLVFLAIHPAVLVTLNDGPYTNFLNLLWIPLSVFYFLNRDWTAFSLFFLLALGTSFEESIWLGFGFALHSLSHKRLRSAAILGGVSVFAMALWTVWRTRTGMVGSFLFANFGANPAEVLKNVLLHPSWILFPPEMDHWSRLSTIGTVVACFLGIGAIWKRVGLIVLPHMWTLYALNGFAAVTWKWHYWIPEYSIFALGLAGWLRERKPVVLLERNQMAFALVCLATALVTFAGFWSAKKEVYSRADWLVAQEIERSIPASSEVAVGSQYALFFGARRCVWDLSKIQWKQGCAKPFEGSCGSNCPEYAVLNKEQDQDVAEALSGLYSLEREDGNILVYKRR